MTPHQAPNSAFDRLPDEIIDTIVGKTSDELEKNPDGSEEELRALASLCKVSRRLNYISTPHLYKTFVSGFGEGGADDVSSLLSFAVTIFSNEHLATLVKNVSCTIRVPEDGSEREGSPGHTEFILKEDNHRGAKNLILARVEECSQSDQSPSKWFQHIWTTPRKDAMLAALLPYLQNLRRLQLKYVLDADAPYLAQLFENIRLGRGPFDSWKVLQNLEDVMVVGLHDKYPTCPRDFAASLLLPSLRRLYVRGLDADGSETQKLARNLFDTLHHGFAKHVRELDFRECSQTEKDLEVILGACKGLEAFTYYVAPPLASLCFKTVEIQRILERRASSLKRLHLDITCWVHSHLESANDEFKSMNFRKMTALQELKISPIYLWGERAWLDGLNDDAPKEGALPPDQHMFLVNKLPPSIRSLHLTNAGHAWEAHQSEPLVVALEGLHDRKAELFPELLELIVEMEDLDGLSDSNCMVKIKNSADDAGVRVEFLKPSVVYMSFGDDCRWPNGSITAP
ncbi:MAG: hypothetical protein M1831_005355 [Alyxoria varia]|nr:MAG: hypothetical protein M1831_005355 [Alyxoria varia]